MAIFNSYVKLPEGPNLLSSEILDSIAVWIDGGDEAKQSQVLARKPTVFRWLRVAVGGDPVGILGESMR